MFQDLSALWDQNAKFKRIAKIEFDIKISEKWSSALLNKFLEDKHQAFLNAWDSAGYTPLIYASENGYLEAAKYFIENYAALDLQNKNGYTALMYASRKGYTDIAK